MSSLQKGSIVTVHKPQSINDIRTAIRELSARAELARKEDRTADADEIDRRIDDYRDELSARP